MMANQLLLAEYNQEILLKRVNEQIKKQRKNQANQFIYLLINSTSPLQTYNQKKQFDLHFQKKLIKNACNQHKGHFLQQINQQQIQSKKQKRVNIENQQSQKILFQSKFDFNNKNQSNSFIHRLTIYLYQIISFI
ncbi:hypothetical protein ABPG74_012093 [Tetrahymena malaccensis]